MADEVESGLLDAIALVRSMHPGNPDPVEDLARQMLAEYEDPTPLVMGLTIIGRFAAHLLAIAYEIEDDPAIGVIYESVIETIADTDAGMGEPS